jgi:hypothetical protein
MAGPGLIPDPVGFVADEAALLLVSFVIVDPRLVQ